MFFLSFFVYTSSCIAFNQGLDFISAISGAATAISNVGPGLGDMIGPNGNFKEVSDTSKWLLSFGMLLGRLEMFAVLVFFFLHFGKIKGLIINYGNI